ACALCTVMAGADAREECAAAAHRLFDHECESRESSRRHYEEVVDADTAAWAAAAEGRVAMLDQARERGLTPAADMRDPHDPRPARGDADAWQPELEQARAELETVRGERDAARRRLDDVTTERDAARRRLDAVAAELETEREDSAAARAERDAAV